MPWGWIEALLGHACPGCGGPLDLPALCGRCRAGLEAFSTGEMVYLGHYARVGPLVRALKYGRREALARALAEPLARAVAARGWRLQGVTAVPTLPHRLALRGYSPPEVLARALAGALGVPYRPVLFRRRYTPGQPTRGLKERRFLPGDLFGARVRVEGAWLLVDDVLTSGATFLRARGALLEAGAAHVYGAFLAVRDPRALGPYR